MKIFGLEFKFNGFDLWHSGNFTPPTTLPANGGNADTVDNKHASDFATSAQGTKADNALPSASYTASDVLSKIKTVDGSGSGLDADSVDNCGVNDAGASTSDLWTASKNTAQLALKSDNHSHPYEPTLTAGTTAQYYRGDKTWQTLDKTAAGLGSVDNTSDASKPVSTAQQTALNGKANSSQVLTNVPVGALFTDSGAKIAVAAVAPTTPGPGDFWYKVI